MLLHLQKGETRAYLRLSTVAYRPGPTVHSVVPGLVSEFEFSTYYYSNYYPTSQPTPQQGMFRPQKDTATGYYARTHHASLMSNVSSTGSFVRFVLKVHTYFVLLVLTSKKRYSSCR